MVENRVLMNDPFHERIQSLHRSIATIIKGKDEAIQFSLVSLLAGGHLLLEDVPGVGKTTLAHALARSFDCSFQRIQIYERFIAI